LSSLPPIQYRYVERGQVLLGHLGPSPNLVDHPVREERLDFVRIRPEAGVVVFRHPDRIRTGVRDCFLDGRQFGFRQVVADRSGEPRLKPAVVLLDDWGDGLRGDVASDQERVGLVERRGREELAEDDLRTVKIGGEEETFVLSFPAVGRHAPYRRLWPAP